MRFLMHFEPVYVQECKTSSFNFTLALDSKNQIQLGSAEEQENRKYILKALTSSLLL